MGFHDELRATVHSFEGQEILGWSGDEWAMTGGGDRPSQFERPDCPFLQMNRLDALTADGSRFHFSVYQDNAEFGLNVRRLRQPAAPTPDPSNANGHYHLDRPPYSTVRTGNLDLPTGVVADVQAWYEIDAGACPEGVLAEVELTVGDTPLLFIAGEVIEERHERISLARLDESVLVFTDPQAAKRLVWQPPRQSRG